MILGFGSVRIFNDSPKSAASGFRFVSSEGKLSSERYVMPNGGIPCRTLTRVTQIQNKLLGICHNFSWGLLFFVFHFLSKNNRTENSAFLLSSNFRIRISFLALFGTLSATSQNAVGLLVDGAGLKKSQLDEWMGHVFGFELAQCLFWNLKGTPSGLRKFNFKGKGRAGSYLSNLSQTFTTAPRNAWKS